MTKFVANILFLLLVAAPLTSSAQYQYMIDKHPLKKRHNVKTDIDVMKQNVEEYKLLRKQAKEDRKVSRMTMNRTYKIQTRKVRRRMMASRCEAAKFNGDHHFWCEPLHLFLRHGDAIPIRLRQSKCKMTSVKKKQKNG